MLDIAYTACTPDGFGRKHFALSQHNPHTLERKLDVSRISLKSPGTKVKWTIERQRLTSEGKLDCFPKKQECVLKKLSSYQINLFHLTKTTNNFRKPKNCRKYDACEQILQADKVSISAVVTLSACHKLCMWCQTACFLNRTYLLELNISTNVLLHL